MRMWRRYVPLNENGRRCEVVYDDNLMERHGGGLEGKTVNNGLLKNLRHCILGEVGELDYSMGNFENCGFEIYENTQA